MTPDTFAALLAIIDHRCECLGAWHGGSQYHGFDLHGKKGARPECSTCLRCKLESLESRLRSLLSRCEKGEITMTQVAAELKEILGGAEHELP